MPTSHLSLHTNLGRAPPRAEAIAAYGSRWGQTIQNLGARPRYRKRWPALCPCRRPHLRLTGAEAALVVTLRCGLSLLSLMATAQGKKVIASRVNLIDKWWAFSATDVIEESGAILKEVGCDKQNACLDYEACP